MATKKMSKTEKEMVWDKIGWEGGFEYFITGSSFPEIKGTDFRAAHKALVAAWRRMEKLLGTPPRENEEENSMFTGHDHEM